MTAEQAYDDCIKAALEGARRQRKSMTSEPDVILAQLHSTAATTLDSFADMLKEMKVIRCP